LIPFV
jgi:hypothetical protein